MNSTRRNKLPQNPACESLEGRQLMTAGADVKSAIAGAPSITTNGPADVSITRLAMPGNAAGGGWTTQGQGSPDGAGDLGDRAVLDLVRGGPDLGGGMPGVGLAMPTQISIGKPGQGIPGGLGQDSFAIHGPGAFTTSALGGLATSAQGGFAIRGEGGFTTSALGGVGISTLGGVGGPGGGGGSFGPLGGFGGQAVDFVRGPGGFDRGGPTSPGSGTPVDGSSTGSTDTDAIKASFEKLRTDLQAIHDKSQVTPALEAKARESLKAVKAAATGTADATALESLKKDLDAARTDPGGPTDAMIARVLADQDAVYKSQGASDELIAQLDADLKAIQTATGITDADRSTIAADQQGIKDALAALAPPAKAEAATTNAVAPPTAPGAPPEATSALATTAVAATTSVTAVAPTSDATTIATASDADAAALAATTSAPVAMPMAPPATPKAAMPNFAVPFGAMAKPRTVSTQAGASGRARMGSHASVETTSQQGARGLTGMPRAIGQRFMALGRSFRRARV